MPRYPLIPIKVMNDLGFAETRRSYKDRQNKEEGRVCRYLQVEVKETVNQNSNAAQECSESHA
jgi:hypothetical protein